MALIYPLLICAAGVVALFEIIRYAVKIGTLEALRTFDKEKRDRADTPHGPEMP